MTNYIDLVRELNVPLHEDERWAVNLVYVIGDSMSNEYVALDVTRDNAIGVRDELTKRWSEANVRQKNLETPQLFTFQNFIGCEHTVMLGDILSVQVFWTETKEQREERVTKHKLENPEDYPGFGEAPRQGPYM